MTMHLLRRPVVWIAAATAALVAIGRRNNARTRDAADAAPRALQAPVAVTLRLPASLAGRPINRLLLGNNVEWVDRGNGVLRRDAESSREAVVPAGQYEPSLAGTIGELRPTVLRYPGGSHADLYHFRTGLGDATSRGENEHFFTRRRQRVVFGTAEFLALCQRLGAEPLVTVNVATGTPQEAGDWVRTVNVEGLRGPDGTALPKVRYWEVGNEPYLREAQHRELGVEPEEFARRADQTALVMRSQDRGIQLGFPLRNDQLGLAPAVHFPRFAERALRAARERYDFVSLHDAYLPFIWDNARVSDEDAFRATMAATRVVREDLDATRTLLARLKPDWPARFAITEYNSFFTIGGRRDANIASIGGALYVADLLMMLTGREDVFTAEYWSIAGNWNFGAMDDRGRPRPAYHVLLAFDRVLRGRQLDVTADAPTFASPRVGAVPAYRDTPLVSAVATVEGDVVRLLVLNKSLDQPVQLAVQGPSRRVAGVTVRELTGRRLFDDREGRDLRWVDRPASGSAFPVALTVAPHALEWVEVRLGR